MDILSSLFVLTFLVKIAGSQQMYDVSMLGQAPSSGSPAGPTSANGNTAVYLHNLPLPENGVLYAFAAYFRNDESLRLQVWRPDPNNPSAFRLVARDTYDHVLDNGLEKIFIESKFKDCIRVQAGDRIGFPVSRYISSPVAYILDSPKKPQIQLRSQLAFIPVQSADLISNNTYYTFQNRTVPYILQFSVMYYKDASSQSETYTKCVKNLPLSADATTTAARIPTGATGPPGSVGPTGFAGPAGYTGRDGYQGPMGNTGMPGPLGVAGYIGKPGLPGLDGSSPRGYQGRPGDDGKGGETGSTGPTGDRGMPGIIYYDNNMPSDFPDSPAPLLSQTLPQLGMISEQNIVGLLVWLAILSVFVVAFFVVLTVCSVDYKRVTDKAAAQAMSVIGAYDNYTIESKSHATDTMKKDRGGAKKSGDGAMGKDTLRFTTMPENLKQMSQVDGVDYQLETANGPL